ncbi:MAG: ATP-binding protein [Bacteroidota bacterium]
MLKLLQITAEEAARSGNSRLIKILKAEKNRISKTLQSLEEKAKTIYPSFQKEVKKRTSRLEKKVKALSKAKETLSSDNLLLEYKKKDLLWLTQKLEEANEAILRKNEELLQQQWMISEQASKLNTIHQQILEKNRELEMQKEALLDQSDYLHEANETITSMHQEVEKQKNEILQKNDELLSLNNEKNNLIGIVAHDLKSPLNQIKGLLSIMKVTAQPGDETCNYITMMEQSTTRLTDMIAKILDVEAIESKQLNLIMEKTDVAAMLAQTIERFKLVAQEKNITLHPAMQGIAYAMVDKSYADQVFENLLSNAIKFSPIGKSVYVRLSTLNGNVITEIKDEGPGLTEEDKKKLFGKYQKLSARPTGNETSTGLGLSIVKKFVEAMNGEIWCESESGKGASFFVAFPSQKS